MTEDPAPSSTPAPDPTARNPVVLDVETTGLDPAEDRVVQVAAVECDWLGGQVGELYCEFVNPGRPIPPRASAVNHVTDEAVADAPPFERLAAELFGVLGLADGPRVLIAHNAPFDARFLAAEARRAHLRGPELGPTPPLYAVFGNCPLLCTYRLALHLVDSDQGYGLQALRYQLKLGGYGAHGAGDDVDVTRRLYALLVERWLARRTEERCKEDPTLAELARFCWEPVRLRYMPLGKHRGARIEDVPTDYLMWVARKKPFAGRSDELQPHLEAVLRARLGELGVR